MPPIPQAAERSRGSVSLCASVALTGFVASPPSTQRLDIFCNNLIDAPSDFGSGAPGPSIARGSRADFFYGRCPDRGRWPHLKIVSHNNGLHEYVAEREGFEPPIRLPVCRISSAVLSTTQPPLQRGHDLCQLLRSCQDISCSADGGAQLGSGCGQGRRRKPNGAGFEPAPRAFATELAAASARACAPGAVASPRVEPEPLWRPGVRHGACRSARSRRAPCRDSVAKENLCTANSRSL